MYDLETETTFLAATDVVPAQWMLWLWNDDRRRRTVCGQLCGRVMLASDGWCGKQADSDLLPSPHHFARNAEAVVSIRHWPA